MLEFIMYGSDVNFIGYLMLMFMLILMLKMMSRSVVPLTMS